MNDNLISRVIVFFFVFPLIVFSQSIYWEDLSENSRKEILSDSVTFNRAVDYYNGNLIPNDDSLTYLLLDTLTCSRVFTPLYFYEFNEILKKSDGALAEAMGEYCGNMIYNYPNETFNFIIIDKKYNFDKSLFTLYTDFMGWELAMSENLIIGNSDKTISLKQLEKYLRKNIIQDSDNKIHELNSFIKQIKKVYKENKQ